MKKIVLVLAAASAAGFAAPPAEAQESRTWFEQRMAAPSSALEITLGTGYTQGLGMLQRGQGMPGVATAGVGFDLGTHARINPNWSIGFVGQYHELTAERATAARGLTGGFAATYHVNPEARLDPWLELGTGYRLFWEDAAGTSANTLTHGFQLARARIGLDLRASEDLALAPVIGADANLLLWQDATTSSAIANPTVNTFLFAGIQGRMDLGGARAGSTTVTSTNYDGRAR